MTIPAFEFTRTNLSAFALPAIFPAKGQISLTPSKDMPALTLGITKDAPALPVGKPLTLNGNDNLSALNSLLQFGMIKPAGGGQGDLVPDIQTPAQESCALDQGESAQADYSDFDTGDTHLQDASASQTRQFERIDFAAIKMEAMEYAEQILSEILPDGFIEEGEYVALNPTRDDRNAGSFRINLTNGRWADFATDDKGGDIISVVKYVLGLPYMADAAHKIQQIIAGLKETGGNTPSTGRSVVKTKRDTAPQNLAFIPKFPSTFTESNLRHPEHGMPAQYWLYLDSDGDIRFVACRFNLPARDGKDSKKIFSQRTYWENTDNGQRFYRYKDAPDTAILYHLCEIRKSPDATVIVCEGEKAADAASQVFPDCVTTTSPGGSGRSGGADWTPLAGRQVIIFPDADEPGDEYLDSVANKLLALGCQISVVDSRAVSQVAPDGDDRDEPIDGWDAADAIEEWHDLEALRACIMAHVSEYAPPVPAGAVTAGAITTDVTPRAGNNSIEHLTDLGNAHRLVRHCDGKIRYVHAFKAWFIWNGDRWERDANGEIYRLAHQTIEQIHQDSNRIEDEALRLLWAYESLVITACVIGGALLAFGQGGTATAAVPLLLVAAAELLRIPVAALSTRLGFVGRFLTVIVLLAIAVVSFEALSLIFEQFLDNRTMTVLRAQRAYDLAQERLAQQNRIVATAQAALDTAKANVAAIDADIANKERSQPAQPNLTNRVCGKNRSTCAVDRKAREDFARAQADHLATLKQLRLDRRQAQAAQEQAAQAASLITAQPEERATTDALHALEDVKLVSPMHRLAASILGVKVVNLTEDQFEGIKRWGVLGLSAAFATISMTVSLIAHQPERGSEESKLARSARAYLARRRKKLVRIVEKPIPAGIKTKYVYVPMSGADDGLLKRAGLRADGIKAYSELAQ